MPSYTPSTPATSTNANRVASQVRAAIQSRNEPLWFPSLAQPLAAYAWNSLERATGLTFESYSTTRLVHGNPTLKRHTVARCRPASERDNAKSIPVEVISADVVGYITDSEVQLMSVSSLRSKTHRIDEALSILDEVATIWPTVSRLVRALHVIDPGDDSIDVSFSDPYVPFTIFVSIPSSESEGGPLRLAEAILHEAMHLHLTLMARVVPLVIREGKRYYSPWRGEERDVEGMLQAIYVFGVIRSFFATVLSKQSGGFECYARARKRQIGLQMEEARLFADCGELTSAGRALVTRLLLSELR